MKKRLIALAVAFVFVLGTVTPGLAAQPDVVDTEFEEAAGKLAALRVMEGFPDGEFKPFENITRAQFARIAVSALALDTAAELSVGATQFNDVPADHWASGYINVATQRGLILGYGDGNYGPEDQLTYAQAVTILVRLVGLGPVVEKEGVWPANYIGRAANEGILKGVSVSGSENAIRGTVAKMLVNTLEVDLWAAREYADDGSVVYGRQPGHTLLSDMLEVEAYSKSMRGIDEVRVMAYDADDNEVRIAVDDGDGLSYLGWFEVAADADVYEAYLNEVTVWINDDDEIIYMSIDSDFYIDAVEVSDDGDELTLIEADKDLDLDISSFRYDVWVNGDNREYSDEDDIAGKVFDLAKVVVNSDGDVVYIDAYIWEDVFVVEDYDDYLVTDYDGDEVDVEDHILFKNGKLMDADDIRVDDILFMNDDFGEVYNRTVEGPIEEYYRQGFEVDGEDFDYTTSYDRYNTRYFDEDGDIDDFGYDQAKDMEAEGEDVIVYVDRKGDAVLVIGDMAETVSDTFAVYLIEDLYAYRLGSRSYLEIEGVSEMGEEVFYDFRLSQLEEICIDGDTEWDDDDEPLEYVEGANEIRADGDTVIELGEEGTKAGEIIEVSVNSSGRVIEINLLTEVSAISQSSSYELELDDRYFLSEDGNKRLSSGVVVFDVTDDTVTQGAYRVLRHDPDDIEATTWGKLSGFEIRGGATGGLPNAYVYYDGSDAEYVIITNTTAEGTTEYTGVLTQVRSDKDHYAERLRLIVDGKEETFYVNVDKADKKLYNSDYGTAYVITVDDGTDLVTDIVYAAVEEDLVNITAVNVGDREITFDDDGSDYIVELVSDGFIVDARDPDDIEVLTLRELRDLVSDLARDDKWINDADVILDAAGTDYVKIIVIHGVGNIPE